MRKIKLSIVIPVYNVKQYIIRCLESILPQVRNESVEIIIVDDESPDNSIELVNNYVKNYMDIQLSIIHQKNLGLGGARNTGIIKATGEYVWFVDSDDEIEKDCLNHIMKTLEFNNDIIIYDYYQIKSEGLVPCIRYYKSFNLNKGEDLIKKFVLSQAWCSIYRRDFLLANKIFFREHFLHEDGEFNMRAVVFSEKILYAHFFIYRYYTNNPNSIMHTIKLKNQTDLLTYWDTAEYLIKDNKLTKGQLDVIKVYTIRSYKLLLINNLHLSKEDYNVLIKLIKNKRKVIFNVVKNFKKKIDVLKLILLVYNTTIIKVKYSK